MTLKELFTDEQKWTREWYAKDEQGRDVHGTYASAVCYCLVGGLIKCYGVDYEEPLSKIKIAIAAHPKYNPAKHTYDGFVTVPDFNDDPAITFQDIIEVVNAADV